MLNYFLEVLHLILRYFHVIAGVAWIGASFYFIWLDNNLQEPPQWKKDKCIKGDLWAVHGGGFYEVAKYRLGPEQMPSTLHWFKWEAYTTWITGTLLLTLLYYVGADAYLLDPSKVDISAAGAIALSVGSIALGFAIYEGLSRSRIVENGRLFTIIITALLALWVWGLDQFLSDRAAYIHIGALIGTCMAANVFFTIIPGQRYMVNEIAQGRVPDSTPGLKGKQRSVHNNYATLPIIFIMLSNHFSFTYSHAYGWLVLVALFINGMWIRHYFNLKHQGIKKPSVFISGMAFFFIIMLAIAPWQQIAAAKAAANVPVVSDEQAMVIIQERCTSCHSVKPTSPLFTSAPAGFIMDTIEQVKLAHDRVQQRAKPWIPLCFPKIGVHLQFLKNKWKSSSYTQHPL
ncbi:MAG: urate hydroxylase PuuD [Reinekea sp.]